MMTMARTIARTKVVSTMARKVVQKMVTSFEKSFA
jgi:hypothetical protein